MTKSLKEIYGNTRKQWKESSRVASRNNINKENLKWRESGNKNLEILAGSSETNLTNRK